ncbi:MAG TPA: hypothetical protein VH116_08950 [Gemmatimonadales bacterium]|nr:hypothetical protein [Gemmatimonadales bacterium]
MRSIPRGRPLAAGVAAAALALLAACHADRATAPSTVPPTQPPALSAAEASSLAEAMTADAQGELEGITVTGGGLMPGLVSAFGLIDPLCVPTISPSPVVDTDHDGVPDSVRVTFPSCGFAMGSAADTVRGSIDLVDPTPTVADHDGRLRFIAFTRILVFDGKERSFVLNGMRQALRDATTIAMTDSSFGSTYTFPDGTTATSERDGTSTFTADVAGSINPDAPLPSGSLNIKATATWTHGTNSYALTVSTAPSLHYNANCTVWPKFDAGTIQVIATRNGTTTTVTISFTACGQYTVTRS